MTLMRRTSMRLKNFCTTVNFLCQKYEKMKKQVGYESEKRIINYIGLMNAESMLVPFLDTTVVFCIRLL